jgi:molecular chaperone DnaK (HSP70)
VSYVSTDKNDIDDIVVISSWPGPARETETVSKAPSRIAYATENPLIQADRWDFQVEPGMTAYSWTKLLLDEKSPKTQYDDATLESKTGMSMLKLPKGKGAVTVCADFLESVYCHLLRTLEKQVTKETLAVTPMEFWFTMPAIWPDEAQSATKRAAKLAGFGSRPGDEIYMITEPEAVAIATLKRRLMDASSTLVQVR